MLVYGLEQRSRVILLENLCFVSEQFVQLVLWTERRTDVTAALQPVRIDLCAFRVSN